MPTPFPTDALAVFTDWLRTRRIDDPRALIQAALSVASWVVGEVMADPEAPPLRGSGGEEVSPEQLADTLVALASAPEGAKAAIPWKTILGYAAKALTLALALL